MPPSDEIRPNPMWPNQAPASNGRPDANAAAIGIDQCRSVA
jgi:hypothetical protein